MSRRFSAGTSDNRSCGDLLVDRVQQVDAVVGRHVGDQRADAFRVARLDDLDLLLAVEIAEDLDPRGRVGRLKHRPGFGGGEPFHELGGAGRMQRGAEFAQPVHVAQLEHFAKLRQVQRVDHMKLYTLRRLRSPGTEWRALSD